MTFEALEKSIIAQISEDLEAINITAVTLPEEVSKIGKSFSRSGLAGWVQLEWIQTILGNFSVNEQNAELTVTYNLDVYCEFLRDNPSSLYNVINLLTLKLWGFRPSICYRAITYSQSETLRFDENYWIARFTINAYVLRNSVLVNPDTSQDPLYQDVQFIEKNE